MYDRYGLRGLQEGSDGGMHEDLFSQLFGGGGGGLGGLFGMGGRGRRRQRGEDTVHPLK